MGPQSHEEIGSPRNSPEKAVYQIQIDETPALKNLRVLLDKAFLSSESLPSRSSIYSDIYPSDDGVNKFLRSLLYPATMRCLREEKAAPVEPGIGNRPRGRPRNFVVSGDHVLKGTIRTPSEIRAAEIAKRISQKKNQRNSKSKERCENRLLCLCFAVMYEIETKECCLTTGAPPAKILKPNDRGQTRRVTNYEKVRAFLRGVMTFSIESQAAGFRSILDLASIQADMLPGIFFPISRTFVAILTIQDEVERTTTRGEVGNQGKGKRADLSLKVLEESLNSIVAYAADWWRRNFTSDVQLPCSQGLKRDNPLISACDRLLPAMIGVIAPIQPSSSSFRKELLYRLTEGDNIRCCAQSNERCMICYFGSTEGSGKVPKTVVEACHNYVEAFQACCIFSRRAGPEELEQVLSSGESFMQVGSVWKHAYSQQVVHRLGVISALLKSDSNGEPESYASREHEFVQSVRHHVGWLWVARATYRSVRKQRKEFRNDTELEGAEGNIHATDYSRGHIRGQYRNRDLVSETI